MKQLTMKKMISKVVLSSKEMTNEDIKVTEEKLKSYLPKMVKNIWVAGFGTSKVVIIEQFGVHDRLIICSGFCMLRDIGKIGELTQCTTNELKEYFILGKLDITKEDIRYGTTEYTEEYKNMLLCCENMLLCYNF